MMKQPLYVLTCTHLGDMVVGVYATEAYAMAAWARFCKKQWRNDVGAGRADRWAYKVEVYDLNVTRTPVPLGDEASSKHRDPHTLADGWVEQRKQQKAAAK